jgi:DNA replication protein DnaC
MPRPPFYKDLPPVVDYWEEKDSGYKVPRFFTEQQISQLRSDANYRIATANGKICPVCDNQRRFEYQGVEYECPDDDFGHPTTRLSSLYFLANIPLEYQQLVWSEWPVEPAERLVAKEDVESYIADFDLYRQIGVGATFWSQTTGTGKTWMATRILKELVKRGYDGWFIPFKDIRSYYQKDDVDFFVKRMTEAQILVLDDVLEPWTEKAAAFYGDKLEDLIRPRTTANLPTIMTTNLSPDKLEEFFPRVFSLVSAKNLAINMCGPDVRLGRLFMNRLSVLKNGERFPIE